MISIIICSVNREMLKVVSININKTIGVEHEIIAINNDIEKLSITKAYNKGAEKSKYKHLVFCHEDISFHTQDWGKELIKTFTDESIGLIGVSGATYKSNLPTSWSSTPKEFYRVNAIQRYSKEKIRHEYNPDNTAYSDVVVIDGLFMATKRNIFSQLYFNSEFLTGFHLYDIDMSVRVKKTHRVVVSNNILIEHFSEGKLDLTWFKTSVKWHKKYKNSLPISVEPLSKKKKIEVKQQSLKSVIKTCYISNSNFLLMSKSVFQLSLLAFNKKDTYNYIKLYILYSFGFYKIKKSWK